MDITDSILSYRRHLKRRNYSIHTIKNYMNVLKHFVVWFNVQLEEVDHEKVLLYIDWLIGKRLKAKTINCQLACISGFYQYLHPTAFRRYHAGHTLLLQYFGARF